MPPIGNQQQVVVIFKVQLYIILMFSVAGLPQRLTLEACALSGVASNG